MSQVTAKIIVMPKTARKRENTTARQKQIIEASRKLTVKYGSEHLTVRRIAHEIGVSEGAIYRHFKSKRDILSLLVDDIEETWLTDIEKGRAESRNVLEILDSIAKNHISLVEQRRGITFQVVAEVVSLGDKKLNNKIAATIQRYTNKVKELLSQGIRAGEIREDIDLDAAAILFFSMTQGLVNIWVLSGYEFNLEQRYAHLWDALRQTLIKR